ncbi:hypothetical protein HPB47_000218, partial [Ixodes persulcatus]
KEKHGVWYESDPHTRCKASPENLSAALEYFTKDELQCSRQGPNQKDVISVMLQVEITSSSSFLPGSAIHGISSDVTAEEVLNHTDANYHDVIHVRPVGRNLLNFRAKASQEDCDTTEDTSTFSRTSRRRLSACCVTALYLRRPFARADNDASSAARRTRTPNNAGRSTAPTAESLDTRPWKTDASPERKRTNNYGREPLPAEGWRQHRKEDLQVEEGEEQEAHPSLHAEDPSHYVSNSFSNS